MLSPFVYYSIERNELMKVYRYKHLPTGLFYQPIKGLHGTKSNLGVDGKIYPRKYDQFKTKDDLYVAVSGALIKKFDLTPSDRRGHHQRYILTKQSDWKLVMYELVEVDVDVEEVVEKKPEKEHKTKFV